MDTFLLQHLVRKANKPNAPLLILLHGYGSDENDLFSFSSELSPNFFIVSAKAPYPLTPHGNAWYAINFDANQNKWNDNKQALDSVEILGKFIDQIISNYDVDKNNITLLGFSQGSILSLAAAFHFPNKIQKVVALSGYLNMDILPKNLSIKQCQKLQIYCSHGTQDQVIPIEWARKTPIFLKEMGISCVFNEFPVGHGISPQSFMQFNKWLNDHLEI